MPELSEMSDREIDEAVALRVMGWTIETVGDWAYAPDYTTQGGCDVQRESWHPSTDRGHADEILVEIERRGLWYAFVRSLLRGVPETHAYEGETPIKHGVRIGLMATPRQLCEAALKVVAPETT